MKEQEGICHFQRAEMFLEPSDINAIHLKPIGNRVTGNLVTGWSLATKPKETSSSFATLWSQVAFQQDPRDVLTLAKHKLLTLWPNTKL